MVMLAGRAYRKMTRSKRQMRTISEMIKTRATQQNAVIDRIIGDAEKAIEEAKKTTENDEE